MVAASTRPPSSRTGRRWVLGINQVGCQAACCDQRNDELNGKFMRLHLNTSLVDLPWNSIPTAQSRSYDEVDRRSQI